MTLDFSSDEGKDANTNRDSVEEVGRILLETEKTGDEKVAQTKSTEINKAHLYSHQGGRLLWTSFVTIGNNLVVKLEPYDGCYWEVCKQNNV